MTDVMRGDKAPATRRILDAARALVARGGAAEVSIGHVAESAGVSKALVHYHFRDKDSLLQALVDDVGVAVVARAQAFISAPPAGNVLDAYWEWLTAELARGDIRILLALAEYDSTRVRGAAKRIFDQRRDLTSQQVELVFTRLSLTPRLPAPVIAQTVLAFVDGLAATTPTTAAREPRPAFDVLWLAQLTLAE
jgi:AcrR family transcriptional regulator